MDLHEPHDSADKSDSASYPDELEEKLRSMVENPQAPVVFGDTEDDFVTSLRELKDALNISEGTSVIYPGSSTHAGVARVFGKENVVHVDPDNDATQVLSAAGYKAVTMGIEEYRPPEQADLIVALNSYGSPDAETIDRLIKPGGWIIANNHTHWAKELSQLPKLTLDYAILPSYAAKDAQVFSHDQVPADATEIIEEFIKIDKNKISLGTQEDHTVVNKSPKYPDGLFAFRREE